MNLIFGVVKDNIFICKNSNTYTYKKNTYKIAYDGNIYSSIIIKQELLSKGYYFETCLEEEIILKAFIEYGFDAYNKFSGHFSIAIWNECQNELTLMRDFYSIKSFYYKIEDNGNIVFSNDLSELLNSTRNIISYDRFINSYLLNFALEDDMITESIKESTNIMFYENKEIYKVEDRNGLEYGYIFDEVAQIILLNLDNISITKIESKDTEISVIASYILERLDKKTIIISKTFSKEKLSYFLSNMVIPFYNLAEYDLIFAIDKIKGLGVVDLESNGIKRFYNIDFYSKEHNIRLIFPDFCREKILKVEEMYYPNYKRKIEKCIDKKFIEKKFQNILNQAQNPINDFISKDINYYEMIYFIRLNNWIDKYNIKII